MTAKRTPGAENEREATPTPIAACITADALAPTVAPLCAWFHEAKRSLPWRDDPTPYHVWLSEIMLQQTRVAAVLPYFTRFVDALPDIATLAACEEDTLLKLWEGLGYYSRARNLQKAARVVVDEYNGALPADFDALLSLPGIGRYTAGAIASIAFGIAVPAVDGNVLRVVARLANSTADVLQDATRRTVERALSAILPPDAGTFNQAMMELGALVCLPKNAQCDRCPLASHCSARAAGTALDLPRKAPKRARRVESRTVLCLVRADGSVAICRRPKRGLLAGLWELPNWQGHLTRAEVRRALASLGFFVASVTPLPAARHVFTHIEWQLIGYRVKLRATKGRAESDRTIGTKSDHTTKATDTVTIAHTGDAPFRWVAPNELQTTYSIPTAFRYYC